MGIFRWAGRTILDSAAYCGQFALLLMRCFAAIVFLRVKPKHIITQMVKTGVDSLPIAAMTSFFIGVVITFQSAYQMKKVGALNYIPSLVSISITREIGPILTAIVVAGRNGASIAAEIGSMKVTEQIDALRSLATDPVRYLVAPRFIALVCMLPLLTAFADFIGIAGGYLVCVHKLGLTQPVFWRMAFEPLEIADVLSGLGKSIIFAVLISITACLEGMRVRGGAEGVGRATTKAVVISFVLIIISDALFTVFLYFFA